MLKEKASWIRKKPSSIEERERRKEYTKDGLNQKKSSFIENKGGKIHKIPHRVELVIKGGRRLCNLTEIGIEKVVIWIGIWE